MDFGEIGLLPESFATYTVSTSSDKSLAAIAKSLGLVGSSNLVSMAKIFQCLWMLSVGQLVPDMGFELTFVIGLNEDGYLKTGGSKH